MVIVLLTSSYGGKSRCEEGSMVSVLNVAEARVRFYRYFADGMSGIEYTSMTTLTSKALVLVGVCLIAHSLARLLS